MKNIFGFSWVRTVAQCYTVCFPCKFGLFCFVQNRRCWSGRTTETMQHTGDFSSCGSRMPLTQRQEYKDLWNRLEQVRQLSLNGHLCFCCLKTNGALFIPTPPDAVRNHVEASQGRLKLVDLTKVFVCPSVWNIIPVGIWISKRRVGYAVTVTVHGYRWAYLRLNYKRPAKRLPYWLHGHLQYLWLTCDPL